MSDKSFLGLIKEEEDFQEEIRKFHEYNIESKYIFRTPNKISRRFDVKMFFFFKTPSKIIFKLIYIKIKMFMVF